MERSQILEAMGELKLYGMRGAYDEIVAKYRDMTMEAYGLEKFYSLFDFTNARDVAQDGFKIFTPASIDPDLALAQKKVST